MILRTRLQYLSRSAIPRNISRTSPGCRNIISPYTQPPIRRSYSTPITPITPITNTSTPSTPSTPSIPPTPFPYRQPPPPKPKRSLRPYIYTTIFLLLGLTAGQYVNLIIAPPPLPLPDSHEDKLMVEYLTKQALKLPVVKALTEDPAWTNHEAYGAVADSGRAHRLTTGPLGGARGIGGFQRVFTNTATGEIVIVVWIGGALAGWPGVTHGGVTATLMDEALGRCAIALFPGKSGVTANLELDYLKPVLSNSFYVMRALPQKEGSREGKQWVQGRIETLDGRPCVEAKALFVVPKGFVTKPIGKI